MNEMEKLLKKYKEEAKLNENVNKIADAVNIPKEKVRKILKS